VHYGHLRVYDEIMHVHEGIHKLGQALIELLNHELADQALPRVVELERMSERFIELAESLYDEPATEPKDDGKRISGGMG